MDSQLLTLSKIFTERLFRIPDYQRGYAWGDKQIKDFWTDIAQLEPNQNHYTGVLTLENVPVAKYTKWEDDYWIISSKNYEPYFVVDGQQRLTTSIILIQVIMEKISDETKLNYTNKVDIQRKFIYDSKDSLISRSYIFGYERDNPSYNYLKVVIFGERISERLEETVYTQNLARAKDFFTNVVDALSNTELEVLYRKVTQNLLFNIFTISTEVDVCVAFETMNNRGKLLSYLELLKNRLIYLSLKFDEPEFERDKLRKSINDCWKAIYHNLGRSKDKQLEDDKFLLTHYLVYFGKGLSDEQVESANRLPFIVRRQFAAYADTLLNKIFITSNLSTRTPVETRVTLKSLYDYVSSLQESVETWYGILNPSDSDSSDEVKHWLDKLSRLGAESYLPLTLVVMQNVLSDKQKLAFLQAVERNLFCLYLFSPYLQSRFDLYVDLHTARLAVDLKNRKTSIEKVIKHINDSTQHIIKQDNFANVLRKFKVNGFYEWPITRYFLYEYNLDLQSKTKTNRAKIFWPDLAEDKDDFISIEHIYPQKASDTYWTSKFNHLTPKQRVSVRNSLGNLLPLSKPKNASLSNKPFPEKARGTGNTFVNYSYGSYAENEVAQLADWTPENVLKRGLKLLNFLERRWEVNLGNEENKISILGFASVKIVSV